MFGYLTNLQHGAGFPTVNGVDVMEKFDANIPIQIAPVLTGPQYHNVFASEFGCSVYRYTSAVWSTAFKINFVRLFPKL